MKTVKVDLGERSYGIRIGVDVSVGDSLAGAKGIRALIVSDSNVDPLYGPGCEKALAEKNIRAHRTVIDAGEASKDLRVVAEVYTEALKIGLDRNSVMVALGGGVVGDLAGFVAATYLRGVRLIQVPTTLLAMVDSSVGGKTGVNLPQGKNLVGAFYQPIEVSIDLRTLQSLPEREYISGLAEVVKYGVIRDRRFFIQLAENVDGLLKKDQKLLESVVGRCCEIKAEVVAHDERESGLRAILNFGHTLAHAIEQVSGYGTLLHGEAVSIGMAYATRLSETARGMSAEDAGEIIDLLKRLGLPTCVEKVKVNASWGDLREAMAADKKTLESTPRFVLADETGRVAFGCVVEERQLEAAFERISG